MQVYHWLNPGEDIDIRGHVELQGVEFENMGQINSENSGLHFFFTDTEGERSIVRGSSIHDCYGPCASGKRAYNVEFTSNVLFDGIGKMLELDTIK